MTVIYQNMEHNSQPTDQSHISLGPDSSLKDYLLWLPEYPLPRKLLLEDPFFSKTLREVTALSDAAIEMETKFIRGLGAKGEGILFDLIQALRGQI